MILAHKIELDATCKQRKYFARACGTARFVWNNALAEWNRQFQAGKKPNAARLRKEFNATKYEQFPWMRDIHRDAHSQPFANLQKAFNHFFKKIGKRPKFKKKGGHDSFYIANDKLRVDCNRIRLPVIGWVRMTEALRFAGKIMGAVVSREADRWFVSIQVDVGDYSKSRAGDETVGIDLGITTAATLSSGQKIEAPKPLRRFFRRLRIRQRSLSRKQKGSKNRRKQRNRVARVHARIRRIRHDFLHKLTTSICKNHAVVAIEDLCVKGMLRNRKLARAISDIGFHEFRRQLDYKSKIYRTQLVIADRWFPSSKTCNACGLVKSDLKLSDRMFRCDGCGHVSERDVNAAKNLHDLCTAGLAETHACGPEGSDGAFRSSVKPRRVEAGTKPCSLVGTF